MLNCLDFEKIRKNNNTKDNEQNESSRKKHTKKKMLQMTKDPDENKQITSENDNDLKDKR